MLLGKFSTVADNWPNVDPHLEPCDQSSMETIVPALPSVQLKIIIKFIIILVFSIIFLSLMPLRYDNYFLYLTVWPNLPSDSEVASIADGLSFASM